MTDRTLELLARLIAFPTVSRDPNRPLIDFAQELLGASGIECELITSDEGRKANLIATIGPADRPAVVLSGHTDVVPVDGQTWTSDPFRMDVRDGRAYGRGTADMKTFVAAALALAERARDRDLATPVTLALSHDEEIGCVGVRSLIADLRKRSPTPRLCIVGEPTSMGIMLGHKGKLAATAIARGVAGHSALAPKGLNAIHMASDFLGCLRETQGRYAQNGTRDSAFAVPYTTLHAGRIAGGTALNIVPDTCSIDFEIRNVAGDDPASILADLAAQAEALAKAERDRFSSAAFEVETVNAYPALDTASDSDVVSFLATLTDEEGTGKVAFGTEGGLFARDLAVPTAVCGPGSMDQGHKADEFIELDQIAKVDRMMDRLLDRLSN